MDDIRRMEEETRKELDEVSDRKSERKPAKERNTAHIRPQITLVLRPV